MSGQRGVPSAVPSESLGMGDLLVELADTVGASDDDGADKSGLRREVLRRVVAAQTIVDAVVRAGGLGDPYSDEGAHAVQVIDALAAVAGDSDAVTASVTAEAQDRVNRESDARRAAENTAAVLRGGLVDALAGRAPAEPMSLALAMLAALTDPGNELAPLRAVLTWASGVAPGTRTITETNTNTEVDGA